jgi:hypothetical protein
VSNKLVIAGFLFVAAVLALAVTWLQLDSDHVQLSLEASLQDNTLLVRGETNLPDKTILAYEVVPVDDALFGQYGPYAYGIVPVDNGAYAININTAEFPSGVVEVWVRLLIGPGAVEQPQEVVALYGPSGEKLTGQHVVEYGIFKRVEVFTILEIE